MIIHWSFWVEAGLACLAWIAIWFSIVKLTK